MAVQLAVPVVEGFAPDDAQQLLDLVEVVNDTYPDTVAFLAGWARGRPVDRAAIVLARPTGVVLDLADGDRVEVGFAGPAARADDVHAAFVDALGRARDAAPADLGLTSLEQAYADAAGLDEHTCGVVAVEDVSPSIRQLTLGPVPRLVSRGTDQWVTLAPGSIAPHHATYSIRRHDPASATVDVWVVRHDDAEASTVAGWAARARPGDELTVWGPKGGLALPDGVRGLLLVCDETGLPAAAAILDERPEGLPAHVVVEVEAAEHTVDLPVGAGVTVTWVFRGAAAPGTGTRLLDAVRSLDLDVDGLFAWGAAETSCVMPVRRHLRRERGVPPAMLRIGGYWRRGHAHDH